MRHQTVSVSTLHKTTRKKICLSLSASILQSDVFTALVDILKHIFINLVQQRQHRFQHSLYNHA